MTKQFKKVVIHIGTERTGSTSVQRSLFVHRDELEHHGVYVPRSPLTAPDREAGIANHTLLAVAFADLNRFPFDLIDTKVDKDETAIANFQASVLRDLDDELALVPAGMSTLMISAEHFHSRLNTTESVARMHRYFCDYAETFEIIVFLRSQIGMAISAGNMQLRRGATELRLVPLFDNSGGWDRILGMRQEYFDLFALVVRFEAIFGRSAIRPFIYESRKEFDSTSIVFGVIGVEPPPPDSAPHLNTSLSRDAQAVLQYINQHWEKIPEARRDRFRQLMDWHLVSQYKGKGIRPSCAEVRDFMGLFAVGNSVLCRAYFSERERLFDIDLNDYPEVPEELDEFSPSTDVFVTMLGDLLRN